MSVMERSKLLDSHTLMPGEVPYDVGEMFFTRTDADGVILAGNGIFRRVSGYEWDALNGAAHSLIRHPDMPKAVFHMMWQTLNNGQSFGGYIKNRSRDGRFYWVYLVVSPVEGGHVSIQIKPTSGLLHRVVDVYQQVLDAEQAGLSPEDSSSLLNQKIEAMGYASYAVFASVAVSHELQERAKRVERPLESWQTRFRSMSDAIMRVQRETDEMLDAFRSIRTVPMNMRILASRLENAGGPISAISVNYGAMLDEMTTWVQTFSRGQNSPFSRIRDAILTGQFLAFIAAMQTEMIYRFGRQSGTSAAEVDIGEESSRLKAQAKEYRVQATKALKVVEMEADHLARSVLDMKRYVTGLSSTRMMCKIESATLDSSGEALAGIVDQLDYCQNAIETRLSHISELNGLIQSNTAMLRATA